MNRKTLFFIGAASLHVLTASPCKAQDPTIYLALANSGGASLDTEEPVGIFTQSSRELDLKKPQTVSQALENDTDIKFQKGGGPGLMELAGLRGFGSANTAVLFDGKRLAADVTGTTDLSVINPAELDRLQVFEGPASPLCGANAQGGVINLSTLSPFGESQAQLNAALGDYNTGDYSVKTRGGSGPLGVAVSGGRRFSGGFQQNGDYSATDITATAGLNLADIGEFKAQAMDSSLANGMPGGTPVPIGEWDGYKERQANSLTDHEQSERRLLGASYASPEENKITVNAQAWTSNNNITAWQYSSTTTLRTYLDAASVTAAFNKKTAFTAQYQNEQLLSDSYGDHDRQTRSLGGETSIGLLGNLEAVASLRYDNTSLWADQLSPRGVLVWRPAPGWKISASAGRAWMAPTFADMYNPWSPQNPNLKPEHSMQYDLGAEMERLDGLLATASVFYASIQDKIALDPDNGYAAYNLDEGRISGAKAQLKFKDGPAKHTLAYSFIYSEGREQAGGWEAAAFNPQHRFSYQGEFSLSNEVTLNVFARHVSEQYTALGKAGVELPAFTTADTGLTYTAGAYSVSFSVLNLTDAHYAENADMFNGYYPMPGRSFRLGVSVSVG